MWTFKVLTSLLLRITFLSICVPVAAYIQKSDLFPYLESAGSTVFFFRDDEYATVNLTDKFKFLTVPYKQIFISGNGYITFGKGLESTGYECNKTHARLPTAAVFMADADNRSDRYGAKLLYRQDTTNSSLNKISKDVFSAFPEFEGNITLDWMLIATWYNIPPYSGESVLMFRNTFQAILTTDVTRSHSFLMIYFNHISWPELTKKNSPARVGIFGANITDDFYLIPGSCTYSLLDIADTSNFDQPGKYAFKIDTAVQLPVSICTKINESLVYDVTFKPRVVSNQQPLLVQNLNICLDNTVNSTTCLFYDHSGQQTQPQEVEGLLLGVQSAVVCNSPELYYSYGKTKVVVRLKFQDGKELRAQGHVYVVKPQDHNIRFNVKYTTGVSPNVTLSAYWNRLAIQENGVSDYLRRKNMKLAQLSPNVSLTLMELVGSSWRKLHRFEDIPNTGSWVINSLPYDLNITLSSDRLETPPRVLVISTSGSIETGKKFRMTYSSDIVSTTMSLANRNGTGKNIYDKKCKQWFNHEPEAPNDTVPCPPSLEQASEDWRFSLSYLDASASIMNPRNYTIYQQSVPSPSGAGSQCFYDGQGDLAIGSPYGSRIYRYSPNNWKKYWEYTWDDVMPYLQCCQLSYKKEENCARFYFLKRSPQFDYMPPVPFRASGTTNIATLDGTTYMLNEMGTFYLLKYGNQLEIQILVEKYRTENTTTDSAVITWAGIRLMTEHHNHFKFQVTANVSNGLMIWLNNEPLNFYNDNLFNTSHEHFKESFTLYHEGVNVFINGTSEAIFTMTNGFTVKFTLYAGNTALNIIGTVSTTCNGEITGLLTNFDRNSVNRYRIPKTEAFIDFHSGKTYENYNNKSIPPLSLKSRAEILDSIGEDLSDICGNVDDCKIDYMLTKNEEFATSSKVAYEQFEKLLNATKVKSDINQCLKSVTIKNGKFTGKDSNIGSTAKATCEFGYYLNITYKYDSSWAEDDTFTCIPSKLVKVHNDGASDGATWVSTTLYQPVTNFVIECLSLNNSKYENPVPENPPTPNTEHCVYPGQIELGIKSLIAGFTIQTTCSIHNKIENVTFTCMDKGDENESFGWVAINNPFLSLNACLVAKYEKEMLLRSAASSNNFTTTVGLILLSIISIVLLVVVIVQHVMTQRKYSAFGTMYGPASMTTNLLELNDLIDHQHN